MTCKQCKEMLFRKDCRKCTKQFVDRDMHKIAEETKGMNIKEIIAFAVAFIILTANIVLVAVNSI